MPLCKRTQSEPKSDSKMITSLSHALRIANTIARFRLHTLLPAKSRLRQLMSVLLFLLPGRWLNSSKEDDPTRLRKALEALGPIYIKLGQMLSTRPDFQLVPTADGVQFVITEIRLLPFRMAVLTRCNALMG